MTMASTEKDVEQLLVGIQKCQFLIQINIHHRLDIYSRNLIRRYLSSRKESMSPHKYLYTNFHSSFLHNRQNTRNNPNDHQLMNKQSLIYPDHGILSSIKRNYQCSKTMWINLKTIMLSERRQTQKITCCNIPLTRNSGKDKKKKKSQ